MNKQEQLQEIFRNVFNDPTIEIRDTMTAQDVANWTSLTHLIMIEQVERVFGVKFALKELMKLKNVGDLLSLLEKKTGA